MRRHRAAALLLFLVGCNSENLPTGSVERPPKAPTPPAKLPRYACRKLAGETVVIDGKLNEAEWRRAAVIKDFVECGSGKSVHCRTEARALYDDEFLYLSFVCYTKHITASLKDHDQDLWKEDVVEVFLDPEAQLKSCFEVELNPLNALYDARVDYSKKLTPEYLETSKKEYESVRTRHAVASSRSGSEGEVWTAELALPFSELAGAPHTPPRRGDVWRWNVFRVDVSSGRDAALSLAWSPTGSWNHRPEKFGFLEFR
jgi:hypothetical protein